MSEVEIGIEVDAGISSEIRSDIERSLGIVVEEYEKSKLDGTAGTVLLYVQALSPLIAAITPIVLHYLSEKRVKKIKCGNIEIENPTPEQVETLLGTHIGGQR